MMLTLVLLTPLFGCTSREKPAADSPAEIADTADTADAADTGPPPGDPRLVGVATEGDADLTITGGFNTMGYWLSGADLDGDGRAELVTSDAYNGADYHGQVYVLSGLAPGAIDVSASKATITGAAAGDMVGNSAAALPDVTGDGLADLAFLDRAKSAYLFAGPVSGALAPADADTVLVGVDRTDERASQINAGDLDGDGQHDLVLSAQRDFGGMETGDVWVVAGPVGGAEVDLATQARAHLEGDNAEERAGWAVATGDADGDGVADLWTSAVRSALAHERGGAVYLFLGGALDGELALADAEVTLAGGWDNAGLGHQLAADGDLEGDGHADLLVSASGAHELGVGAVYLFSGPLDGLAALSVASAVLINDLGTAESAFGYACHADFAGDPDGDGHTDVLGSDCEANVAEEVGGVVGLHYGPLAGTIGLSAADLRVEGSLRGDGLGKDVGGVGDLDGDGLDDVAMGSFFGESVYVFFGGRI